MTAQRTRSEKLDLRLTPLAKKTITAAAAATHSSVSEFVLKSALQRAEETLADRRTFSLDEEQWAAFQEAMDAPPRVLPELKRLLERKAPWEE